MSRVRATRTIRLIPKSARPSPRNILFRSPASTLYMTILQRFTFPVLCIFYLVACNAAKTISMEALGDTPARVTNRFVFPTSGSSAEAYLTRPAGPGPFPLMILLHGHTFESIGGGESLCQRSLLCRLGRFASRLWRNRSAAGNRSRNYLKCSPGRDFSNEEAPVDRF